MPFYRVKGMTYVVRLMSGIHCKAWMLVEVWRCLYPTLTIVPVFDL
jgi:hypothetical protein